MISFGEVAENGTLNAIIKNEIAIEIEDSSDENEGDNEIQADGARNKTTVQNDANKVGNHKKNDAVSFTLGEVVISLDRCDSERAKDKQAAKKGDTKAKATPKRTPIRKSPRV